MKKIIQYRVYKKDTVIIHDQYKIVFVPVTFITDSWFATENEALEALDMLTSTQDIMENYIIQKEYYITR